ncbi:Dps family protein [Salipiger abyssi]|uniref:Starvation-inducible DNA-binding protein n=1 Tax=Salipiger abyssi TaxID=1250539 RepID=A0A1P8UQV7_9RHOB|nr:DNA starvation/stationary phase protection protein [Salipiger abyssi]APZ51757.1 starvation-inducible DNA-binding protein [Salipiger abyssi]
MLDNTNRLCVDAIARALADTHMLYMKAHNFHWNVEGPQFQALHAMFEEQYTDLAEASDELAERIRALGAYAPGTSAEFAKLATVRETEGRLSATEMLSETVKDYETVAETLRAGIAQADDAGDDVTAGMLTDRLEWHDKAAWMMRAMLA